ncbi:MAG: GGDEF domain-containing protein [Proteobacteria bacterium]|nr:MAG: GGDEF domain-containing protein [Pseudomonadota bacterium]
MNQGGWLTGLRRVLHGWNGVSPAIQLPRSDSSSHRAQIRAEQIRVLYEQLPSALLATSIAGALVVYVLWSHVPLACLLPWFAALTVTTSTRVWLMRAYFRAKPSISQAELWGRRFLVGVLFSGVIWGFAGVFPLPPDAALQEVFLVFVLGGLAAGGMSTLSSFRGAYAAFLIPAILPFAAKLMLQGSEMFIAMSWMLILFIAMMSLIAARHYSSVTESLRLRFDNAGLVDDLAAARDRQQAINQELEGQMEVRQLAEEALRRAYDDLDRKVQERTGQLAKANDVLRTEKELFRVTLASIGDAVITTDAMANVTYLNAVAEMLTGWDDSKARGHRLTEIFRIVDEVTREPCEDPVARCLSEADQTGPANRCVLISRDQRELNIDMSVASIQDSDSASIGVVLVFRDVTEERKLAQQLAHQATHDTLTGLVNRLEFERRLSHLLDSANPHAPHALLYLDLDQFKVVNDTCGHAAGDDLLRQISALLRTKLRARDTLARLGGDEFGVLLEHCSVVEAQRIANALRELLQGFRFGWSDRTFTIGVSIGLVPITQAGETLASVFSAADSSCYAAKEKGRNRVHVYEAGDAMLARRDGEMRWMPRIQQALADERFRLYYQPILPVGAGSSNGSHGEILIRMLDESGRIVLPGAFLPAAERYGLMLALDRWVVKRTLEVLSANRTGDGDVSFAINLSGQSLGAADFLDFVTEQLDATRVTPSKLCFEITETSAVSELAHALRLIDTLKGLGCRFALDDFGTGLSSFSYLKTLPVDYLKIDGGFVTGLVGDDIDQAMVEAVHHIGHMMRLKTIAEWVESRAILLKLKQIGVNYGQGYALGQPRPLDLGQR